MLCLRLGQNFKKNETVILMGLKSRLDLNGKQAIIVGKSKDRWIVQIESAGESIKVKVLPGNLQRQTVPCAFAEAVVDVKPSVSRC